MRYPKMMQILEEWPNYAILVYVGRLRFNLDRSVFLSEIEYQRGTNFRVDVEVDHDCNEIVITQEDV